MSTSPRLAERSDRFTGADLEDLTRRAGLAALKRSLDSDTVTMEDFEAALKDTRASVTEAMEKDYEKIQGEIKQAAMSVDPIGLLRAGHAQARPRAQARRRIGSGRGLVLPERGPAHRTSQPQNPAIRP